MYSSSTVQWRRLLTATAFIAVLGSVNHCMAKDWRVSPQICQGRPYARAAKAAGWDPHAEKRVCLVTTKHPALVTSSSLTADANFALNVRCELADKSALRLTMGKETVQLNRRAKSLRLVMEGMTRDFDFPAETPWTWLAATNCDSWEASEWGSQGYLWPAASSDAADVGSVNERLASYFSVVASSGVNPCFLCSRRQ